MSPAGRDVSVVIPVWDDFVERFLPEALASIRAQDLAAEIVIVDNASSPPVAPPDAVEVVRAPERLTLGAARNLALNTIATPFVVFWDADDVMLPGALSAMRRRLEEAPDAFVAATGIVEAPGVPHHWPRRASRALAGRRTLFALVHAVSSQFPTIGAALIRTEAARDAGGFADADAGEDWVLGVSLAFRGRILLDPHPGRLYRQWNGTISSHSGAAEFARRAASVRRRLRSDPAVPVWIRALSPALLAPQLFVIYVVRPLRLLIRRATRGELERAEAEVGRSVS
jgi:glycosyltransferase involved in cell wall biosynthesis